MKQYIFGRKNVIHIIDLRATLRGLIRAAHLLKNITALGEYILFVGTKRQARSVILEEAGRVAMPYVSDRWLGGTLTNFATVRSRLHRLVELEQMEESGRILFYSKKEIARLRRELHKLHRNLGGIRDMSRLPGALVVVDPGRENIAVREARKLEIPVVGLVDTDTNPELVDIVIPCNDDAFRSIKIVLSRLTDAVIEGKVFWEEKRGIEQKSRADSARAPEAPRQRRTRRRDERPRRRTSAPRAKAAPKAKSPRTGEKPGKAEEKPKADKKTEAGQGAQEAQAEAETT
jgi:small subunit ribosomal protein S2